MIRIIGLFATLLICETATAQNNNLVPGIAVQEDAIGIRITIEEWNKSVADVIAQTNHNDSSKKDTAYYMKFVRIINTIEKNRWFDKYAELRKMYYDKVFGVPLLFLLDAGPYKGGCFYSSKLNLFVGGTPHANSMFYITPL